MLQTMLDMQLKGFRADFGAKPSVVIVVIKVIVVDYSSPSDDNQFETKVGTFKRDLKNWIKLSNMSEWGKDPITGALLASNRQWEDLLAIKANKDALRQVQI